MKKHMLLISLYLLFFPTIVFGYDQPEVSGEMDVVLSDQSLIFEKYSLTKDWEGNDAIGLYYTYTNNKNQSDVAGAAAYFKLFQNGRGLEISGMSYDNPEIELINNVYKSVRDGASIEVLYVYTLLDMANPIDIEVYSTVGFNSQAGRIDIAQYEGKEAEAEHEQPIDESAFSANNSSSDDTSLESAQIKELEQENQDLIARIEELEQENKNLASQNGELKKENEESNIRVDELNTKVEQSNAQVEELKAQNKELTAQIEKLTAQSEAIKAQNEDLLQDGNIPSEIESDEATAQIATIEQTDNNPTSIPEEAQTSDETISSIDSSAVYPGIIYQGNDIVISLMECSFNEDGLKLNLIYENNSSLNLGIMPRAYAVNGVVTGTNWGGFGSTDVASGKKANAVIDIDSSILGKYGISSVQSLDFCFWAYDNDKSFKSFDTGSVHLGDTIPINTVGTAIYEGQGLLVEYISRNSDTYTYRIHNYTGSAIGYEVENVTVNDFTIDVPYDSLPFEEVIPDGCAGDFDIILDEDTLDENYIDTVQKLEFTMSILPGESYSARWSTSTIGNEV